MQDRGIRGIMGSKICLLRGDKENSFLLDFCQKCNQKGANLTLQTLWGREQWKWEKKVFQVAEHLNALTRALGVELRIRFPTSREVKFWDVRPERSFCLSAGQSLVSSWKEAHSVGGAEGSVQVSRCCSVRCCSIRNGNSLRWLRCLHVWFIDPVPQSFH